MQKRSGFNDTKGWPTASTLRRVVTALALACLLTALLIELSFSVRQESQTWDEGNHVFAGYRSWTHADFGLNPEHPPLVKLLATTPLLTLPLQEPNLRNRFFKEEAFLDGRDFVFENDFETILFRSRMAAAVLTLLLALVVFLAAREMFGTGAAFITLSLLVFDPNLLAHGAYVTTDAGLSLFMFATVYAFYRYVKVATLLRLVTCGLAAGLALATKHTGLLIFPMLILLAICEVVRSPGPVQNTEGSKEGSRAKQMIRLSAALIAVSLMSVALLWAFYGFRYRARPEGLELSPPLNAYAAGLRPSESRAISALANWRLLPAAYLYGLVDVRKVADESMSYVFGKPYAHGVWFYFPVSIAIKSTVSFLGLALLAGVAIVTRRLNRWREVLFLTVPPAFHLLVAMSSGLNIGVRHILPLYAFISVLIGGAAWAIIQENRKWLFVVVALLTFQAISSARAYPDYVAYANELWGGPANTYRYLTDSNVDWGQQLKATKQYLDQRGVKDCWFAYFGQTVIKPSAYGIPCKPMPTIVSMWLKERMDVPLAINGPVLISAGTLSGYELGPGALNPYEQFKQVSPTAIIENGILVYDGHFEVPLASALTHSERASELLGEGQPEQALTEARQAVSIAPDAVRPMIALGDVLATLGQRDEARVMYEQALTQARGVYPEFQWRQIEELEGKLARR
jgi:hypothetical protein